jgi:hypothetical protein
MSLPKFHGGIIALMSIYFLAWTGIGMRHRIEMRPTFEKVK